MDVAGNVVGAGKIVAMDVIGIDDVGEADELSIVELEPSLSENVPE